MVGGSVVERVDARWAGVVVAEAAQAGSSGGRIRARAQLCRRSGDRKFLRLPNLLQSNTARFGGWPTYSLLMPASVPRRLRSTGVYGFDYRKLRSSSSGRHKDHDHGQRPQLMAIAISQRTRAWIDNGTDTKSTCTRKQTSTRKGETTITSPTAIYDTERCGGNVSAWIQRAAWGWRDGVLRYTGCTTFSGVRKS